MIKVLAFGTFDLLHPGHLFYLAESKKLGSHLTVIIARNKNVEKFKGEKPVHDEKHRLTMVKALKQVDEALLGDEKDIYKSVEKVRPDIVALGYDQKPSNEVLKKEFAKRNLHPKIVRISPFKTDVHKTTKIKEKIRHSQQ